MKSNKIFILIIVVLCFLLKLEAEEPKKSTLYYLKLGAINPPGGPVLPELGLGIRHQKGNYGFDINANLGSLLFINYATVKGLFLYYPRPEHRHQLYFGAGPGFGYYLSYYPMGGSYKGASEKEGILTLEGVMGYEFRHTPHFKTFVQLEFTQPLCGFGPVKRRSFQPGAAITGGIGF